MKKTTITLLLAVCCILWGACRKSTDKVSATTYDPITRNADKTKLNALFAVFRSEPQEFNLTIGGFSQVITGTSGTRLVFYPNSFRDENGNTITSGTVKIELIEMYKPGQMIANRASTTSNGNLLRSTGQIHIEATKDGKQVFANKYSIQYSQPANAQERMSLYYGNTANEDSVVDWVIADTTRPGNISPVVPGDTAYYRYVFDSTTSFGFVNSDWLLTNYGVRTIVKVILPDARFNPTNTQVFFAIHTYNTVLYCQVHFSNSNTFSYGKIVEGAIPFAPVGSDMSAIVLSNVNGTYYYSENTHLTVSNGLVLRETPQPQTIEYIKTRLSQL